MHLGALWGEVRSLTWNRAADNIRATMTNRFRQAVYRWFYFLASLSLPCSTLPPCQGRGHRSYLVVDGEESV